MALVNLTTGDQIYFPFLTEPVQFEGRSSRNPLAFKFYEPERVVAGKTMREHFHFAVSYWHTFCGLGNDPFGGQTHFFPWNTHPETLPAARQKMDAAFEFITKMGIEYYCFHDVDAVGEGNSPAEFERNLAEITDYALQKQQASGVKLLWGTTNAFSHVRFMNGAATNPDFQVLAHLGLQVKNAIDATIKLGGGGYVFWGGREGYMSLLNTDMKRETEHLGRFLGMARDYGRKAGFTGTFMIEPKPMEPTKHQYDFDAATVIGFLREYGLENDFKLNIETNHATLAGHTFAHEIQVAGDAKLLGSLDANRGDYQNGWDTDQFPVDLFELTEAMLAFLDVGGIGAGGVNFDAKIRRNSTDLEDLFIAHIGGMDVYARALLIADEIRRESNYLSLRKARYASFDTGEGARFEQGQLSLEDLRQIALTSGEPKMTSGKQELYEYIINQYI
jgi:xylose isomerase